MTNKIYRTASGKIIDYEALLIKNETVNAIGNNPVNARGDEIGPGGEIIRSKNDVVADYYAKNPNAVQSKEANDEQDKHIDSSLNDMLEEDKIETNTDVVKPKPTQARPSKTPKRVVPQDNNIESDK